MLGMFLIDFELRLRLRPGFACAGSLPQISTFGRKRHYLGYNTLAIDQYRKDPLDYLLRVRD